MADVDNDPDVSDDEILTVFAEMDESPLYSWEVAEQLPITTDDLEIELDDLEEQGLLESDDDYAPGTVWRLDADVESEDEVVTETEQQATAAASGSLPRDQETVEDQPPEPGEQSVNPRYELPTDAIEQFDPPGMSEQKDRRREALRHAYGYLREEGRADREELVSRVYPQYRGAYEEPDDGWWEEVIRPGFEQLPGVESTDDSQEWTYVGTDETVAQ